MKMFARIRGPLSRKELVAWTSVRSNLNPVEVDEKGTIRRWLEHNAISYDESDIIKAPQNSDVDIIFDHRRFQITKLPANNFMKSLRNNGSASFDNVRGQQFVELIREA